MPAGPWVSDSHGGLQDGHSAEKKAVPGSGAAVVNTVSPQTDGYVHKTASALLPVRRILVRRKKESLGTIHTHRQM